MFFYFDSNIGRKVISIKLILATQINSDCQALLRDFAAGLALRFLEIYSIDHNWLVLVLRAPPPIATFTAPVDVFSLSAIMDEPFLANELRGDFELAVPIFFLGDWRPTAAPFRFEPMGVDWRIAGDFDAACLFPATDEGACTAEMS